MRASVQVFMKIYTVPTIFNMTGEKFISNNISKRIINIHKKTKMNMLENDRLSSVMYCVCWFISASKLQHKNIAVL